MTVYSFVLTGIRLVSRSQAIFSIICCGGSGWSHVAGSFICHRTLSLSVQAPTPESNKALCQKKSGHVRLGSGNLTIDFLCYRIHEFQAVLIGADKP